jgi:hypothetical protein
MAGSGVEVHSGITVVLWPLVIVTHDHGDGRAQGDAELGAGLDLDSVLFVAGGRKGALAGATTCHLRLDVIFCELHSWWYTVDDAAHGAAMRLAIAGRIVSNWRGRGFN